MTKSASIIKKVISISFIISSFINLAHASNSVDLKVTARLLTGSCIPSMEGGGVVDFGHVPMKNLSKTDVNQLGTKNITLTVTCGSVMPVAWTITDNHFDTMQNIPIDNGATNGTVQVGASSNEFGIGKTAAGVNIGAYSVSVYTNQVSVDGVGSDLLYWSYGTTPTNGWNKSVSGATLMGINGEIRNLTAGASGSLAPLAGKVFVYPLYVTAAIQSADTLGISDNTNLDGSATISLIYI